MRFSHGERWLAVCTRRCSTCWIYPHDTDFAILYLKFIPLVCMCISLIWQALITLMHGKGFLLIIYGAFFSSSECWTDDLIRELLLSGANTCEVTFANNTTRVAIVEMNQNCSPSNFNFFLREKKKEKKMLFKMHLNITILICGDLDFLKRFIITQFGPKQRTCRMVEQRRHQRGFTARHQGCGSS